MKRGRGRGWLVSFFRFWFYSLSNIDLLNCLQLQKGQGTGDTGRFGWDRVLQTARHDAVVAPSYTSIHRQGRGRWGSRSLESTTIQGSGSKFPRPILSRLPFAGDARRFGVFEVNPPHFKRLLVREEDTQGHALDFRGTCRS